MVLISTVQQSDLYIYIYIYIYILSHILFHYRLLQDIECSSLCYRRSFTFPLLNDPPSMLYCYFLIFSLRHFLLTSCWVRNPLFSFPCPHYMHLPCVCNPYFMIPLQCLHTFEYLHTVYHENHVP